MCFSLVPLSDVIMTISDLFPPSVDQRSGFLLMSMIGVVVVLRRFYVKRLRRYGSPEEDWFHPVGILKLIWRFGSRYFRRFRSLVQRLWRNEDPEKESTDKLYAGYDSTRDTDEEPEAPEWPPAARADRTPARVQHQWRNEHPVKENVVKTTDEFYCNYDSTWDSEEDSEEDSEAKEWPPARAARTSRRVQAKFERFCKAARDMQMYRHGRSSSSHRGWRPPSPSTPDAMPNLSFYLGRTRSQPDGVHIEEFHSNWLGEYDALEFTHTFIQWLFPLREPGMNSAASPLTEEEVKEFCQSREAQENLLESYKLMLDFYGIELYNDQTGAVRRAKNWRERFNNLNQRSHNNLRITRIIKCLGILGYHHLQAPLVQFFLNETLVEEELHSVTDSVLNYFVFAVRDKAERRRLVEFAYLNYHQKDEFVWCPNKIQARLQREQQQY